MTISTISGDSLLALDIGTSQTRAALFDVIQGRYRFVAMGTSRTTINAPYNDVEEGVRRALEELQDLTGRIFLGAEGVLIMPTGLDGAGVDACVATMSAGPPLRVVAVGLLEEVSVESARRLAETTYAQVVEALSLNDRRRQEERIDAILQARPDLIIMAGGIEGGATLSVRKMLECVGLANYLLPRNRRPQVLFAGNYAMQKEIEEALSPLTDLHLAANVRPSLEFEQLSPAQTALAKIFKTVRANQFNSVANIDSWTKGTLIPSSKALSRVARFLSRVYDSEKGVLAIDIGSSATTITAAFEGLPVLGVYPQLGLGRHVLGILEHTSLESISRWLFEDITVEQVRDYIHNKAAFPDSIPATKEELAIEQALARQAMRIAVHKVSPGFPKASPNGLLPGVEPLLATGSVLTQAPSPGQGLLMLLDGLQPTGVTTVLLDQNSLLPAIGAAAEVNAVLAVQVLGSNILRNLGTVISPIGNARHGAPILRADIKYNDGSKTRTDIKFGSIETLALPQGETAVLRLQPSHRFDVGAGKGRAVRIQAVGGVLGVVIDARGRPLRIHPDPARRIERYQKWFWTLST